jgi:hypothetical protein
MTTRTRQWIALDYDYNIGQTQDYRIKANEVARITLKAIQGILTMIHDSETPDMNIATSSYWAPLARSLEPWSNSYTAKAISHICCLLATEICMQPHITPHFPTKLATVMLDIIEKHPETNNKILLFGLTPILLSLQPPPQANQEYSDLKQRIYTGLENDIHFFAPLPESSPNNKFIQRQKIRLLTKQTLIWGIIATIVATHNLDLIMNLTALVHP